MTAEVAILNNFGVALAADSAVTLDLGLNDKKIYNSANKIFTLSKYHPVGIMIYNNAKIMDIEWEIIIKSYRKVLGKKFFNTLDEYENDFFSFLVSSKLFTDIQQNKVLTSISNYILAKIKNSLIAEANNKLEEKGNINETILISILDNILAQEILKQKNEETNNLVLINAEEFKNKNKTLITDSIIRTFEKFPISQNQIENIFEIIHKTISVKNMLPHYTGIVIAGYGDSELFPSITSSAVYGIIENNVIRTKIQTDKITLENPAIIMPFAQTEMVNSFMEGSDPSYDVFLDKQIKNLFEQLHNVVDVSLQSKLEDIRVSFIKSLNTFKRKIFIDPIINIVASLHKTDLAEMAEALVNLTSFKRHVSSEAETVGGPTDVAIISKGDGFIWIKRKHYFELKYNQHFVENYFREGDI